MQAGIVRVRVAAPQADAVVVPSVVGTDQASATAFLTAAGLVVRVLVEAGPSSAGIVWRQEPGEGVSAPRGREVVLWVAP